MKKNILIIGDTIIDKSIYCEAIGLSLEAPCIKTKFLYEDIQYGGAANVAKYAAIFGANVSFITSVDTQSEFDLKNKYNINVINVIQQNDNVKSRIFITKSNCTYQYLQINDTKLCGNYNLDSIDLENYDIIAFSDYRLGLIKNNLIKKVLKKESLVYAASQISSNNSNFDLYKDVDFIVCNENEATYISNWENVYITKAEKGCEFRGKVYNAYVPTKFVKNIGAGDCFYAALLVFNNPDTANKLSSTFISGII